MTSAVAPTAKSLIFRTAISNCFSRSAERVFDLFAYLSVSQTKRPGLRDNYYSYAIGKSRMLAYGFTYATLEPVPFYGPAELTADDYPQARRFASAFQYRNFKFRRLPAAPNVKYFPKSHLAGESVHFP
jgi:hypothetical protein